MDMGGLNWFLIDVVAVVVLLFALAWVVIRNRGKGTSTRNRRTEEATRELYEAEDEAAKQKKH